MAYRFDGSTSYLELTTALVAANDPVSFFAWANADNTTQGGVSNGISASTGQVSYRMEFSGATGGDPIRARKVASSVTAASSDTGAYVARRWTPAVSRFISNTARYCMKDFTIASLNTTSVSHPSALDRTNIGCYWTAGARALFFIGRLAEIGFVRGDVTVAECQAYSFGVPLNEIFRDGRLLAYLPLLNDTGTIDLSQFCNVFTNNAATPVADHPPIIRTPKRRFYFVTGGGAHVIAVGQASETDTAPAITVKKTKAIGQVSETDTAPAVTAKKTLAIGIVTETDSAFGITVIVPLRVNTVIETDSAQPIAVRKTKAIGQASETGIALPLSARKTVTIGQVSEAGSAFALTARKTRGIGIASEAASAFGISIVKTKSIGQVSEADTAQPITARKTRAIGIATETDSAFSLSVRKSVAIGIVSETDTAFGIASRKALGIGIASELDEALPITVFIGAVVMVIDPDYLFRPSPRRVFAPEDVTRRFRRPARRAFKPEDVSRIFRGVPRRNATAHNR